MHLQMHALQSLKNVQDVDVIALTAQQKNNFLYEYEIHFKGLYLDNDWPILTACFLLLR